MSPQLVNLGKSITDFSAEGDDDEDKDKEDMDQDEDHEKLDEDMGERLPPPPPPFFFV